MEPAKSFQILQNSWKEQKRKQYGEALANRSKENDVKSDQIEKDSFDLFKNITLLSATVFASSIALATGKSTNVSFIAGELLLLVSTISGGILLWTQLESGQWLRFLDASSQLKMDLIQYEDVMEDFIIKSTKETIHSYEQLMKKKNAFLNTVLRIIKVDWLPTITFISLFIGLFLIWLSLIVPFSPSTSQQNTKLNNKIGVIK